MATTTNYSWTTPDDTALVKDGAAAIRSLGTAIDSTVFTNAGAAINKTIVDAKGDLIVGTAADTVARLASSAINGNLLTVDTSTASGLKWAAPAAAGKIGQVINALYDTETSTTSTSYGDTGLSASITPSATSSKVLIIVSLDAILKTGNAGYGEFALLKGATVLKYFGNAGNSANGVSNGVGGVMLSYLDTPSTTSSTTYKAQFKSSAAATTIYINTAGANVGTSSITLMEVLA